MMKLAVITDEVSQDFGEVLRFARDFSLDGLEIRSVGNKPPHQFDKAQVEEIRKASDGEGFAICGVASPVFKCDIENPAEIEEQLDILKRCMELAEAWNAPMIRVFTGWRRDNNRELLAKAAEVFRKRAIPLVQDRPYYLGVENEFSTNMATGDESRLFLDAVASEKAGLVWDPCNILYLEHSSDPFDKNFSVVRGRVAHVHIKDAVRVKEREAFAEAVAVGDGQARLKDTLDALREDGYAGWVSLETHWRLQAKLSEDVTRSPMGAGFSAGAEPASRECMKRLKAWLRDGNG